MCVCVCVCVCVCACPRALELWNSTRCAARLTFLFYRVSADNVEVAHLRTLTRDDVLDFYRTLIRHDAPRRHKLSVQIRSVGWRHRRGVQGGGARG